METDVAEGSLGTRDGKNIDGKEEINEARQDFREGEEMKFCNECWKLGDKNQLTWNITGENEELQQMVPY